MVIRTFILRKLIENSPILTDGSKKSPNFFKKKRVTVNTKWVVRLNGKTLSGELSSPDMCYDFIMKNDLKGKSTTIDVVN